MKKCNMNKNKSVKREDERGKLCSGAETISFRPSSGFHKDSAPAQLQLETVNIPFFH